MLMRCDRSWMNVVRLCVCVGGGEVPGASTRKCFTKYNLKHVSFHHGRQRFLSSLVLSQTESEIPHIIAPHGKHLLCDEYIHSCTTLIFLLSWEHKTPCLIQYLLYTETSGTNQNRNHNKRKTTKEKKFTFPSRPILIFAALCSFHYSTNSDRYFSAYFSAYFKFLQTFY